MKFLLLSPNVLVFALSLAFLSSAALQNNRRPLPGEFEPFRLSIGADSIPDFVSSRYDSYETPRNSESNLEEDENESNDGNKVDTDGDDPEDRAIAATEDIEITEVAEYSGTNLGTEPGNPPYTVANPGVDGVMRTQKVASGLYSFRPPMDIVDVKVTGGPAGAEKVECFIITKVRGRYIKFGLGVWIAAEDAVGVYCAAYYAMEEVEEEGWTGLE